MGGSKKTIVQQTLRHRRAGEVPYTMKFTPVAARKLQTHFGVADIATAVGCHLVSFALRPGAGFAPRQWSGGFYNDEFGCVWQSTGANVGQIKAHPLKTPSLAGYRFPDPGDPARVAGLEDFLREHAGQYVTVSLGNHTLVEMACNLRGMTEFMTDLIDAPDFAGELLDGILEYAWGLARQLLQFETIGALKINDDWGDQRGIMLGVERWRQLVKPRIAELCRRIRRVRDVDIFLHSDGNIAAVMPDIVELGIAAVDPMQPEVMDLVALKRQFGREITLVGGMSTQRTMPFGTPEDVAREARRLMETLGEDGGFILTPGIIVQEDVPLENVLAFIGVCRDQGGGQRSEVRGRVAGGARDT
ncbi:MAG: uroporphyrinogen decarboxylase family protein [Kiritimatiellae bacterium]|nr:uroporphyrinogen decarboxylase family protein [Kiritimatiellia bacterium]